MLRDNPGSVVRMSDFVIVWNFVIRHLSLAIPHLISLSCFGHLDQFDFITLRRIDKRNASAIGFEVRSVRILETELFQMSAKLFEALHFKGQMRQIGLDVDRAAGW